MKKRGKWRIIPVLLLMAGLAMSMVSGCTRTGYDHLLNPDDPVTITVWHYYNGVQQTQFDQMVSDFNKTVGNEKGIRVEAYSKNSVNELAESVLAAVNGEPGAEEAPDIFGTYAETAYQIDKAGRLADLSRYISKEEKAEYVEAYMAEGAFNGKDSLMIFPTAKSTEVMMINLTDWEKFAQAEGVSYNDLATWEGLVAVAEKYYRYTDGLTPEVKNDGKAFFGRDSVANYMVIGAKQLGHEFASVDKDGHVQAGAHKETVKRLWENFYVPFVKGYFSAQGRFRSDDAKTGTIIALICSTTGAVYYPSEVTPPDGQTYPIQNVVLNVPNFEGTDPYIVQQGAGMSVIKSDEKSEYASTLFLKWITDEERNISFSVKSGYLPVKNSANDFDKISASEAAAGIDETMMNTFKVAADEINRYSLYTSPPYEASAEVRNFIGRIIEDTAKAGYTAAADRIAAGEERDAVLEEYTNDAAFEKWYAEFEAGLNKILKP